MSGEDGESVKVCVVVCVTNRERDREREAQCVSVWKFSWHFKHCVAYYEVHYIRAAGKC